MSRQGIAAVLSLVLIGAASAAAAQTGPAYKLVATIPLGAPDRWDYVVVDAPNHRAYLAHGDRIAVIDIASNTKIGDVIGFAGGSHGTAISAANGRGYGADGKGGLARSFDLKTLTLQKALTAAADADAVALDPKTGHVFTMDSEAGVVTAIDPVSDSVIKNITIGGSLEYAQADGAGHLFVNGADKKEIVRIDTATNAVTARWPVPDCASPHGMAIDPADHRLFTSCVNQKLIVVNTDTGAVVAVLPIGLGTDAAAYDPARHRIFSSNGRDGTVTIIQQTGPDNYAVAATLKTAVTGRTMDVDPTTGRLYIAAGDIDPASPAGGRPKVAAGSLKLLVYAPE
jgi:DNA-binding beta-propeller fold protein YncE